MEGRVWRVELRVECGGWSVESGAECGVWRVECGRWRVELRVWSVELVCEIHEDAPCEAKVMTHDNAKWSKSHDNGCGGGG